MCAFELGAIDYLEKPFGRERVRRAVERALPQVEMRRARTSIGRPPIDDTVPLVKRVAHARLRERPVKTIYVRDRGSVIPLRTVDVERFDADGDFVAVFTGGRRYLVCLNLGDLAAQLDPERFLRVHRSHIVNLAAVVSIDAIDANRAEVEVHDGTRVAASRTGTRLLRSRMKNPR